MSQPNNETLSTGLLFPHHRDELNRRQTRCVIRNGIAINLVSTIYIYDKLAIGRGKIENKFILRYIMFLKNKKNS
jgi:hypothetical protein